MEGIYRLAGSSRQIDALKMQFQYGRSVLSHPSHSVRPYRAFLAGCPAFHA